jgi:hypothetical protein
LTVVASSPRISKLPCAKIARQGRYFRRFGGGSGLRVDESGVGRPFRRMICGHMARVDVVPNRLARFGGGQAASAAIERKARAAERDAVLPGRAAELRAVPVIGRGVSGAIPGTRPDTAPL